MMVAVCANFYVTEILVIHSVSHPPSTNIAYKFSLQNLFKMYIYEGTSSCVSQIIRSEGFTFSSL